MSEDDPCNDTLCKKSSFILILVYEQPIWSSYNLLELQPKFYFLMTREQVIKRSSDVPIFFTILFYILDCFPCEKYLSHLCELHPPIFILDDRISESDFSSDERAKASIPTAFLNIVFFPNIEKGEYNLPPQKSSHIITLQDIPIGSFLGPIKIRSIYNAPIKEEETLASCDNNVMTEVKREKECLVVGIIKDEPAVVDQLNQKSTSLNSQVLSLSDILIDDKIDEIVNWTRVSFL